MKVPKIAIAIAIAMMTAEAIPSGPVARSRARAPRTRPRRAAPGPAGPRGTAGPASGAATLTGPTSLGPPHWARLIVPASLGPAPQRDPRVEHRVPHVHREVDHDEAGDEHQRDTLYHGLVLRLGRPAQG